MTDYRRTIKFTEIALIAFVWLVLLVTPVFFKEENDNPIITSILKQLEILIPLSVLFLINRFLLVPNLLFKGKRVVYVLLVIVVIGLLVVALYYYHNSKPNRPQPPSRPNTQEQLVESEPRNPKPDRQGSKPAPPYANFLILSFLIVGFDTGLRATLRWTEVEQEKVRLEKEYVATQLVLLKNQVSPHFFMNTLNNIHALVDINTDEAKESIIKLSRMMRYLLYETETEKTTLKKEIEFLENYIDLMKIRFNEKVSVSFRVPSVVPDKVIPPFLFTSLIENAFKHGISYKDESFVDIEITVGEDKLLLVVKNSKVNSKNISEYSGIGVENTRKRLDLLYGTSYHIDLLENENTFTVILSIPL